MAKVESLLAVVVVVALAVVVAKTDAFALVEDMEVVVEFLLLSLGSNFE